MTVQEFSNEFDILYNNIMSNQAPGLNEYEKSVFLTQAQENIIRACYQGTSAGLGPFENTELVRRELSNLIVTEKLDKGAYYGGITDVQIDNGQLWSIPSEVLYIIQEYYETSASNKINIIPITNDEVQKIKKNPFRGPSKDRVLRLDYNSNQVILILPNSTTPFADEEEGPYYVITYLKKPYPIILADLSSSGLSINDQDSPLDNNNPCELSSSIHRLILTQAVSLAAAAYKS